MDFITWTDKMSVGVDSLDADHKKLLGIFNRLHRLIREKDETEKLSLIIEELDEYAGYHFNTEEKILSLCKYPDLEVHKTHHEKISKTLSKFMAKHKKGTDLAKNLEFYDFVSDWMLRHVLGEDRKYVEHISNRNNKKVG